MSRIMLAIKTVIANSDKIPVLIFDEIDTGISGKASNKVAEKLSKIAKFLILTPIISDCGSFYLLYRSTFL